jgi:hypothetical protein
VPQQDSKCANRSLTERDVPDPVTNTCPLHVSKALAAATKFSSIWALMDATASLSMRIVSLAEANISWLVMMATLI